VRSYSEQYQYDPAGNLTRMKHTAGAGSFTRTLNIEPTNNRLASVTAGNGFNRRFACVFDGNGNLIRENTERHFEWDHNDRMKVFRIQVNAVEPSVHAQYLYDTSGQRVKKLVRLQGGAYEVTVYIDGLFEHHRRVQANNRQENNTLHIVDDKQRITVRIGAAFPADNTPAIKYRLGDHLDGSSVVIDDTGAWVNREEYTPYGETSFGSFARKRYRSTGKERDEESGLYYHGARYYAPWMCRWVSCDPAGPADGPNLYIAFRNTPLNIVDPTGTEGQSAFDM
jgi:RHS repeat-associated protein